MFDKQIQKTYLELFIWQKLFIVSVNYCIIKKNKFNS